MKEEWIVIVNPNAGNRKGEKDWKIIEKLLKKNQINFISLFTEAKNHAMKYTEIYIEQGYRKFIIVGGDGTFNEAANAVMTQQCCPSTDIYLSIIPIGTGNDWGKTFNIPHDYKKAIDVICKGKIFIQDVGKVSYYSNHEKHTRYIVNSAGTGIEALICQETNRQKDSGKRNPLIYFKNMYKALVYFKGKTFVINIEGKTIEKKLYLCSVGICKYKGNGMKLLPYAIPDDGLLDVTIIYKKPILQVIKYISKVLKGLLHEVPFSETFTCKNIKIDSTSDTLIMEVDGESLGNNPYNFEIIPKCLKVIINEFSS